MVGQSHNPYIAVLTLSSDRLICEGAKVDKWGYNGNIQHDDGIV